MRRVLEVGVGLAFVAGVIFLLVHIPLWGWITLGALFIGAVGLYALFYVLRGIGAVLIELIELAFAR